MMGKLNPKNNIPSKAANTKLRYKNNWAKKPAYLTSGKDHILND